MAAKPDAMTSEAAAEETVERYHEREGVDSIERIMHVHRYQVAQSFARGKRVLDFGCGDGYGTRMLADRAAEVLGCDQDDVAVHQAAQKYVAPNLRYRRLAVAELDELERGSFDLIVCYELIEHVDTDEQEQLTRNLERLLADGGVLLMSTPNAEVKERQYERFPDWRNPFHVRELTHTEFAEHLGRHFRHVRIVPQVVEIVSLIGLPAHAALQLPAPAAWVNLAFASQSPFDWPADAPPAMLPSRVEMVEEQLLREREISFEAVRVSDILAGTEERLAAAEKQREQHETERLRFLTELDRLTAELLDAKRRIELGAAELQAARHAIWLLEESLGHQLTLIFDRAPQLKRALIRFANTILRR